MKGNIQVCKYLHCLTTSCQTSRLVFLSADFLSLCPAHWGTIHLNVSDTWVHSKCMLWGIYTAESLPRWHNLESKIDCFRWHFHLWLIGLMLHFSLIFLSFFLYLWQKPSPNVLCPYKLKLHPLSYRESSLLEVLLYLW